ncbi:hypothetical protein QCB45_07930 [Thiomicrorhabdus sp. ZW0627]|uniref:hypothetical protein n=1 Tax=Thiomicrorhabdus sp. ZW0627 TaxID=3039774 RepID=UPI00243636BD|nr:hypothetical protein [Thiomicrorhabdus sp. ZW0627]MDG6774259.1 hypothetical protein [Thiomicrorhabdus sp. ZW0627]
MQLSYQKPGTDHPMYGKVEYIVADGMQPICYKTKDGYMPLENGSAPVVEAASSAQPDVETKPLYVLSFKINGEEEEMTFKSKKKLDKTMEEFSQKGYVTDLKTTVYQTVA